MKYSIENIVKRYNNGETLKYIFFWGHQPKAEGVVLQECLSQWYNCSFIVDDVKYSTAEQYMMSQKAMLFKDVETYNKIMQSNHPKEYKQLGRQVKNFNEAVWESSRYDIVLKGNLAKFSQNEPLKEYLLSTNYRVLVEASPYDTIWGIGCNRYSNGVTNPNTWKGLNLLGFALMEVRDTIREC